MRLGFIGLGHMGRPMARRLLAAGHELTAHNRSRAVVEEFVGAGAAGASSPDEVVEASEVVLTALPYPTSIEEVYFGPGGICHHARAGQVIVDHSTIGPDQSRRIAAALLSRGADFLDAPVSGGPEGAERGSLAIMVGGSRAAFDRVRPILLVLGSSVHLCGPSGAGSTMKLLNQILISVHTIVTAEAVAFAEQAGLDPHLALDLIPAGLAGSAIFDRNARRTLVEDFAPGARLDLLVKDAALVRELCDTLALCLPVFFEARNSLEQAFNKGYDQHDLAAVIHSVRPTPPPVGSTGRSPAPVATGRSPAPVATS